METNLKAQNISYRLLTPETDFTYDGQLDPKELCGWESTYYGLSGGLHFLHLNNNDMHAFVAGKELENGGIVITSYAYVVGPVTLVFSYDAEKQHYKQEVPGEILLYGGTREE